MDAKAAAATVDHVSAVRRRVRRRLSSFWFPLLVFGGLTLGSLLVIVLANGPALGVYWAIAGILGGIATGRHYRRRGLTLGVALSDLDATPTAFVLALAYGVVGVVAGLVFRAVEQRSP